MGRQFRVAVVGAGPAGIYAADALVKGEPAVRVDVFDRLPTPFGLIRYGVAPDHPRIKEVITALHQVMDEPRIRFVGNVDFGVDITAADLDAFYDATVFATGADRDRELDIPGIGLPGSFGAADFVSWYDGHPDVPHDWPLNAEKVGIIGAENVALDVARVLARPAGELLETEIPDNVHRRLLTSPVTDVHIFVRRGPADVKFTPMELRELDESPGVEVVVDPDGFEVDEDALRGRRTVKMCVEILKGWAGRAPLGKARRIHLHFFQTPVAILGDDRVTGLRTDKRDWELQAVYRAIGYRSRPIAGLPFDPATGTIPHEAGRVAPGRYVTGWIKRGPVGLIGHTRKDARETIATLLADLPDLPPARHGGPPERHVEPPERHVEPPERHVEPPERHGGPPARHGGPPERHVEPPERHGDVLAHLAARGLEPSTWESWLRLDRHEIALAEPHGRKRIKVVPRAEMLAIGRA